MPGTSPAPDAACVNACVMCAVCMSPLQKKVEQELLELRNKSFVAFFMLNALFVLIVFLLQLNKDELHINWPLGMKENITINSETQEVTGTFNCQLHLRLHHPPPA